MKMDQKKQVRVFQTRQLETNGNCPASKVQKSSSVSQRTISVSFLSAWLNTFDWLLFGQKDQDEDVPSLHHCQVTFAFQ